MNVNIEKEKKELQDYLLVLKGAKLTVFNMETGNADIIDIRTIDSIEVYPFKDTHTVFRIHYSALNFAKSVEKAYISCDISNSYKQEAIELKSWLETNIFKNQYKLKNTVRLDGGCEE